MAKSKSSKKSKQLCDALAKQVFEDSLWWSYERVGSDELINLSSALSKALGREVSSLKDIMGKYATSQLKLKIDDAIENYRDNRAEQDLRFVASFETVHGKRSYQNQMRVFEISDKLIVWSSCVDVTEMVELEREMVDAQGRLTLAQVIERQKFLEDQNRVIKDSYARQSRFLAWISHELRSPLLGISSLVKRLKKLVGDSVEASVMLRTINMTAEQSTYLVNDILTFSQTEYDSIKLHPTKVELSELLENVKQLTKSIANDKGLNLSMVQLTEHDSVYVDSVRLTQILINLIINGIKFTQYGGVNLEVKEVKPNIYLFRVSDSGEGIARARLEEIFEPFAQVDSLESSQIQRRSPGAGLGLFVVKQLVELMGGKIDVSSLKNVGTQFRFELNLESAVQSNLADKSSQNLETGNVGFSYDDEGSFAESNDNSKLVVLVADDSEINRMVIIGYLEDFDCEVVEAKDGMIAWEKLQEQQFDYVLLDIQMPIMDGIEVARNLHDAFQNGAQPNLKGVFAITAGGEVDGFETDSDVLVSGVFDQWLVKPVNKSQICDLLNTDYRNKPQPTNSLGSEPQEHFQSRSEKMTARSDLDNNIFAPTVTDIPSQFQKLIPAYISEMQQCLEQANDMISIDDNAALSKLAHYMKGNAMLFQLNGVVELCKQLELAQVVSNSHKARPQDSEKIVEKIHLAIKSLEKSMSIGHNTDY